MQRFLCILALPVVLMTAGCATSSNSDNPNVPEARPNVIKERVLAVGWTQDRTSVASSLYALKCGRCHKFYDPAAYSAEDWNRWMVGMSKKSKLTTDQEELLSAYLAAAREKH